MNPAGLKNRHGAPDAARVPFFIDVSDGDGKHSGGEDALQKTPGDDLAEAHRRPGENGGKRKQEGRPDHGSLAAPAIGKPAEDRRGQRDGDRRSRDREADGKLAGMKQVRQQRQQRLRGIQVHEGGEAGDQQRNRAARGGSGHRPPGDRRFCDLLPTIIVHNSLPNPNHTAIKTRKTPACRPVTGAIHRVKACA